MLPKKLPREFYIEQDLLEIAPSLLGKFLVTKLSTHVITSGMIVDVEAYGGAADKASHAYGNKRTIRTETMYMLGGHAYVYLCYGLHHIFNIVTAKKDMPQGVMLRALLPSDGVSHMLKRHRAQKLSAQITLGPGNLTKALGITTLHDKTDLCGNTIWLEDRGIKINPANIETTTRIGIAYAKEHANLPWRFKLTREAIKTVTITIYIASA